jgi:YD repeat-containing protein
VIRPLVLASLVALIPSAACVHAGRQAPATAPSSTAPAREPDYASTILVRPLHKGGADLSTGVYIREDDDLVVNTHMPIVLRRTYNSGDAFSRRFGVDTTHPGEWWIHGDGDRRVPWGELILANGGRIRFTRISPGENQEGAVLRHDATPTEFNGALLSWNGSKWEMRFRDGALAVFQDCPAKRDSCSLVERRDPEGHRIAYVRDDVGTLLKMESEDQSIAFDYDDHKRITHAYDTSQREVWYVYDGRGRLVRATGSDGTVRDYEYNERNNLVGIREPGRILQNWFDDTGRWVKQVLKDSEYDDDPYVATVRYTVEDGSIVQADFDEGDGLKVYRYNAHHYIVSETRDADGPAPIVFTYERDPVTNASNGVTMSCLGPLGPITQTVQALSAGDRLAKDALIRQLCRARN